MKIYVKAFLYIILSLCIFIIFLPSKMVFASKDILESKKNEDYIFNLELDGYWEPGDTRSHDFSVRNINGEKCYLDSLSFSETWIIDLDTNERMSFKQASDRGIVQIYDVLIELNDSTYGHEVLYNGKLEKLYTEHVYMPDSLFLDINQTINFSMTIYMNKDAKSIHKNKKYEIDIYSEGHKVIYDEDKDPSSEDKGELDKPSSESGISSENSISDKKDNDDSALNKVNKYFKTGEGIIAIVGYEIMCICLAFIIIIRIRQKQNAL